MIRKVVSPKCANLVHTNNILIYDLHREFEEILITNDSGDGAISFGGDSFFIGSGDLFTARFVIGNVYDCTSAGKSIQKTGEIEISPFEHTIFIIGGTGFPGEEIIIPKICGDCGNPFNVL
jgi:hypothetical protein